MKSHQRSWGKFCQRLGTTLVLSLAIAGFAGCSSVPSVSDIHKNPPTAPDMKRPSLMPTSFAVGENAGDTGAETSLADDQKNLEDLRKEIPTEKRDENDQLKEILSLMGEVKDPPQRVRERFNRITQRLRDQHRREVQKIRKTFDKQEKDYRDTFYKKLKESREGFLNKKSAREDRQDFFNEQDTKRREYQADERDRRHEFSADVKMKDDDFNNQLRDKTSEFNQMHREYTQRYNELQKSMKEKKEQEKRDREDARKNSGSQPEVFSPMKTGDGGR